MKGAAARSPARRLAWAVVALVAGAVVCSVSLWRQFAPRAMPAAPGAAAVPPAGDEDAGDAGAATAATPGPGDLLLLCGSYARGTPVPFVFGRPTLVIRAAAPGGETAAAADAAPWTGDDPSPMQVSFIMAGEVSRAVVDGAVVGVGSEVAAGRVHAIVPQGIEVQGATRTLFYDLAEPWPREFRAERRRRGAGDGAPGDASR